MLTSHWYTSTFVSSSNDAFVTQQDHFCEQQQNTMKQQLKSNHEADFQMQYATCVPLALMHCDTTPKQK